MDFLKYADSIQAKLHMGQVRLPVLVGLTAFTLCLAGLIVASAVGALSAPSFSVEAGPSQQSARADEQTSASTSVFVHVAGAVHSPGLYELASGARVQQAIDAAGGFTDDAATDALNLARVIADGEQIVVPHVAAAEEAAGSSEAAAAAATPQAATDSAAVGGKVNINSATSDQLQTLKGVGPALAQRIIDDRTANGPFKTIEDLKRVSGIGDKTFASLSDGICVG